MEVITEMGKSSDDFRNELLDILNSAENLGVVAVEVKSGNLHRRVGDYPGSDHRMPTCCDVMRSEMNSSDVVVSEPDSTMGASVVIRYKLPRSHSSIPG